VAYRPKPDHDCLVSNNPIIVIEALPRTRHIDKIAKLNAHVEVPSIPSYLIIDPDSRIVVHQHRDGRNYVGSALLRAGPPRLEPPGRGRVCCRATVA
jgi:hypothetical protein